MPAGSSAPSGPNVGNANENNSAMTKMTAGPQDQANWLMPMLAARLVEDDISEM